MARALCFGLGFLLASGRLFLWFPVADSDDFWPKKAGGTQGEVHPDRAALLAEVQQTAGLTWTPGIVERFAAEGLGKSKSYGVKGNVSQANVGCCFVLGDSSTRKRCWLFTTPKIQLLLLFLGGDMGVSHICFDGTYHLYCILKNRPPIQSDLEAIQEAISRGDLERVLFIEDGSLPENFDSAEQWPECAKMINDIRALASKHGWPR